MELLQDGSEKCRTHAARALANLVVGDPNNAADSVRAGANPLLEELQSSRSERGNEYATVAFLSNLLAVVDDDNAILLLGNAIPLPT